MSGWRTLATVGLILLATAVVPPLGAFAVNRARVRAAEAAVRSVALGLRDNEAWLLEMARGADVLCGTGRMPLTRQPAAQGWLVATRAAIGEPHRALPADPWGNCYVVNLAAVRAATSAVWALSAGPDGMLDTPFAGAAESPAGDDVGVRIR